MSVCLVTGLVGHCNRDKNQITSQCPAPCLRGFPVLLSRHTDIYHDHNSPPLWENKEYPVKNCPAQQCLGPRFIVWPRGQDRAGWPTTRTCNINEMPFLWGTMNSPSSIGQRSCYLHMKKVSNELGVSNCMLCVLYIISNGRPFCKGAAKVN